MSKKNVCTPVEKPFKHWDLLCVGFFFALTVIVFSSFLFSDKIMVSSDQLGVVGMKQFLNNSIMEHQQIPMWDSPRLGGMPTIDAKYGDIFYPPTKIMRMFFPAHRLYGYTMILHVFLAGVFFFFMMRRSFSATRLVAFAGALFYMLSPQFVSHVSPGHDGKMFVIAWLPFVIWQLRSLLERPTLRNVSLMAVGMGMITLTGHVQMAYFVCLGIFLYWATHTVKAVVAKEEKKAIIGKAVFFWAAVFIGLGIAFVQLYPSYMFVREAHSVRGIDRGFEFAASWSINWAEFFSLWVHEFGNSLQYYWGQNFFKLNTEYAGAIPLLLTFLAVASKPKSVWRIFWAGVAVLAVLYSLGANTPIFTLFYYLIPGVRRFRAPSMIMFWFTFSTVLMSALFIKDLINKRFEIYGERQRKWGIGLGVALGAVTLLALVFSSESAATSFASGMMGGGNAQQVFQVNFSKNFVPNLWFWWLMSVITLGMLTAVVFGKLKPITLVYTLIVMGAVDMIKVNNQFIKLENYGNYFYRNDPTLTQLKKEFEDAPFRVFSLPRTFPMQNHESVYGLEAVGGFHDNELNFYRAFRGDQGDANYLHDITEVSRDGQVRLSPGKIMGNTPFLDLADVEYILMGSGSGISKIDNLTNLGRLSYASDFVVMPEERIIEALRMRRHDYRTTVALVEEPVLPFTRGKNEPPRSQNAAGDVHADCVDAAGDIDADCMDAAAGNGREVADNTPKQLKFEWQRYSPNQRIAAVTMPADGFLRISEVYYPGWRIKVDGSPVKYYRSDMTWMAVPLKAGSYVITMEPRSLYLEYALLVTLIFTALTCGALLRGWRKK